MPFVLTIKGGTGISSPPDVCKVPSPGGPIPCPFVNIVSLAMADPSTVCKKVMVCKSPAFTVETTFILSQGDEGGPLGGVMSGKFIGPAYFFPTSGSSKVNFEGKKAVPLLAMIKQNGKGNFNTTGQVPVAAQTKVIIAK